MCDLPDAHIFFQIFAEWFHDLEYTLHPLIGDGGASLANPPFGFFARATFRFAYPFVAFKALHDIKIGNFRWVQIIVTNGTVAFAFATLVSKKPVAEHIAHPRDDTRKHARPQAGGHADRKRVGGHLLPHTPARTQLKNSNGFRNRTECRSRREFATKRTFTSYGDALRRGGPAGAAEARSAPRECRSRVFRISERAFLTW